MIGARNSTSASASESGSSAARWPRSAEKHAPSTFGAPDDVRPIHYDRDYAQAAGYPTVFSVGMLQAGILATYVADRVGPANLRRISVRFEEQVWPGDQLTYRGLP
jgi:acyl dehydratase